MEENKAPDNEKRLYSEIEKRLNIIESSDYVFPVRLNRGHYLIVCVVALICLTFLIIGAFL